MEPITLCGALIVIFGLWVEFESKIMMALRWVGKSTIFTDIIAPVNLRRPVCVRKMPICFAKTSHY